MQMSNYYLLIYLLNGQILRVPCVIYYQAIDFDNGLITSASLTYFELPCYCYPTTKVFNHRCAAPAPKAPIGMAQY